MELVTVFSPGAFNAVKFVVLYLFVDHIMVWIKAKLKRSVNAADLIEAIPVHIDSIKDSNGRSTISGIIRNLVWLLYSFPAQLLARRAGNVVCRMRRLVPLRIIGRILLYILPALLFGFQFALEYGTGEALRCKNESVQLQAPKTLPGFFQGSVACTKLKSTEKRKGPVTNIDVEYSHSYVHNRNVYCGCAEWTKNECIHKYKERTSVSPDLVTWETTTGTLREYSRDVHVSRVRRILEVRREFSFPSLIPWKPINDTGEEILGVYCYYYNSTTRSSAACIRRNDNNIGSLQSREVLMIAETNRSLSIIYVPVPNVNQSDMSTLSGIIDGPFYSQGFLTQVYQTTSSPILRDGIFGESMFEGIFQTMLFFRMWTWNINHEDSVAAQFAKIVTAIAGARGEGTGTLRTCTGTNLTLNNTGVIASICLLALLIICFSLSITITPESWRSFFTRGHALESEEWALNALLPQVMPSAILWRGDPLDAVTILERNDNQLNLVIANPGNPGAACNPGDIPNIP